MKQKWISTTFILSALVWIALILRDNIGQLKTSVASLEPLNMGMAIVPAMLAIILNAFVYFLILSRISPARLSAKDVIMPFITSQVVRYLPGKLWGILYQAQATSRCISASNTITANVEHYTLVNLNSIVVAISILAYFCIGIATALGFFLVIQFLIFVVLRKAPLTLLLSKFARITNVAISKKIMACNVEDDRNNLLIIALLQAEWVFYFLAFVFVLPLSFGGEEVLIIATCYAMAWLVGALAIVLPNGLVLREASFVWLAGLFGFEAADMIAFSVVARILFTLADVSCATLSMLLMRKKIMVRA